MHLAEPTGPGCPSRNISVYNDPGWTSLVQTGLLDPAGIKWKLKHRPENIRKKKIGNNEEVVIKTARDSKSETVFTGAYMRTADFVNGGTYRVTMKAACGEGKAVTGITLWDGPDDGIAVFNYIPEKDWTMDVCAGCLEDPVTVSSTI